MVKMNQSIGVLGAGTWGIALARMLYNSGHTVCVWSALKREVEEFSATRRHPNLPGMEIPAGVAFTEDIAEVCKDRDVLLLQCRHLLSAVPPVWRRLMCRMARSSWMWLRASRQIPC